MSILYHSLILSISLKLQLKQRLVTRVLQGLMDRYICNAIEIYLVSIYLAYFNNKVYNTVSTKSNSSSNRSKSNSNSNSLWKKCKWTLIISKEGLNRKLSLSLSLLLKFNPITMGFLSKLLFFHHFHCMVIYCWMWKVIDGVN